MYKGMGPGEYDPVDEVKAHLAHEAKEKPKVYGKTDWVLPGIIYIAVMVVLTTLALTLGGAQRMHVTTILEFILAVLWIFMGFPFTVGACVIIGAGNGPGKIRFLKILGMAAYLIIYLVISFALMNTFSLPV